LSTINIGAGCAADFLLILLGSVHEPHFSDIKEISERQGCDVSDVIFQQN